MKVHERRRPKIELYTGATLHGGLYSQSRKIPSETPLIDKPSQWKVIETREVGYFAADQRQRSGLPLDRNPHRTP